MPVSTLAWEIDPVAVGSLEAVVLQAATNRSGAMREARVRIFFKCNLPLLCLARETEP
jgi:hypothetical protein